MKQSPASTRILIVEDNPGDARLILEMLAEGKDVLIQSERAGTLAAAQEIIARQRFDVILLDLGLTDSQGLDTLSKILPGAADIPIIVLTGIHEDSFGIQALQRGAQDYLMKGHFDANLLTRAIHYAIERKKTETSLSELNLDLEKRIRERTAELSAANEQLSTSLAKLAETEKEFRLIVETLHEGIWVIDGDAKTSFVNPRMADMLDYTPEEMARRHLFSFMDEQGIKMCREKLERRQQGVKELHEFEFLRKDGGRISTLVETAPIFSAEGIYNGAIAGVMDVTERKRDEDALRESDERFRVAIESSNDGFGMIKDERHIYVNKKLATMFGYDQPEDMIGLHLSDLLYPDDKSWLLDLHRQRKAGRDVTSSYEIRCRRKNGSPVIVESSVSQIMFRGEPVFINFMRDITARKQLETELKASQEQLRSITQQLVKVDEIQRHRLAMELHDQVGQNLTALGINLNILRDLMKAREEKPLLSRIDDSLKLVEKTGLQIRDIMANLRPSVLDDYGLLATLRWFGQRCATRTGLKVVVEGRDIIPRPDATVETAMYRITQEAVHNIVKHAGADQVLIYIGADDQKVLLTIEDNGKGFDVAAPGQEDKQAGWGLAIMMERAVSVGGECHVHSRPGQGTMVTVEVPR